MPELPDVEAIRRYLLARGIVGRAFTEVTLHWPKAVRQPSPEEFCRQLVRRRIQDVRRRGKFLLVNLDNGTLVLHLRMTGSLVLIPPSEEPHHLTRTLFELDDGRRLLFVDGRKLGNIWLLDDPSPILAHLGPEPLDRGFTSKVLGERLRVYRG
ncbi:MAG: DNA-formamidopyrimidine glycosylase, partial [Chloroflexi bacterium]|nr:DNA-formamidopyrimidine glycosylase [Chloroflexota bacterium]